MRHLVEHQIENHLETLAQKSLLHCHAPHVHSLMILDSPEQRIRLFVAERPHNLWRNFRGHYLSVGYHPHHCKVTLLVNSGTIYNLKARFTVAEHGKYTRFRYESKVKGDNITFVPDGKFYHNGIQVEPMLEGQSCSMYASELHTVGIKEGAGASWFVFEGQEDKSYVPQCFSNVELDKEDFSHLYKPMTQQRYLELLKSVDLF